MDILMVILAIAALALVPWGLAAGASALSGSRNSRPQEVTLRVTEGGHGMFFVRWASYDSSERRYYARLEQRAGDKYDIVSAPTREGLEQEVAETFRRWEKEWPEEQGWPLEALG